jgi:hypothetical protein
LKIAEEIPPSEKIPLDSEPAVDAVVVHHESDAPPNAAVDEATARLQRQIEELKRSEEIQRQAATMPQRPLSREGKLTAWRTQGMSAEDERALTERPEMIDYPRLTAVAAHEAAQQGYARGTDGHRQATRQIFDEHLARLQAQDTARATAQPTPEFFRPLPPPPPPERERSSIVSAPVSREVPSANGARSTRQIRLTVDEREAAALAGVTEVEYAKQKQRLMDEQAAGNSKYSRTRYE